MTTKRLLPVLVVLSWLPGCASNGSPIPDYPADLFHRPDSEFRKVALVTDLAAPEIEAVDLGLTRGEGVASGAGAGALAGLSASGEALAMGAAGGPYAGAIMLLVVVPLIVAGSVVGAVAGAAAGYSTEALTEAETNARAMLETGYLQAEVLQRAQAYARDNVELQFIRTPWADPETFAETPSYPALSKDEIDIVLEVDLIRLSLEHRLQMDARARLVSADTNTVLSDARYEFISEPRRLEAWLANEATPLTEAIERGLQTLAEEIVDEAFLLYHPSRPGGSLSESAVGTSVVPYYVLSPNYPPLMYCFLCLTESRAHNEYKFVEVDSVEPTLRWERFPRPHDIFDSSGTRHAIDDVRYELRVFDAVKGSRSLVPGRMVYRVGDLPDPTHRIGSTPGGGCDLAIFPFDGFAAYQSRHRKQAERELDELARRFVHEHDNVSAVYTYKNDPSWASRIDSPESFWIDAAVSEEPDVNRLAQLAPQLGANCVLTYRYQLGYRTGSEWGIRTVDIYLFDARTGNLFHRSGKWHQVDVLTDHAFAELLTSRTGGLVPCTEYFWTVRARFQLDGRTRVTEWAGAFNAMGMKEKPWNLRRNRTAEARWVYPTIPEPQWYYFPFRTPRVGGECVS